jgi:hypothetical protein
MIVRNEVVIVLNCFGLRCDVILPTIQLLVVIFALRYVWLKLVQH